jgi:glycosyltransferase involved in cell wall biosynthesis
MTIRSRGPIRVLQVCARYLPDMGGIETHVDEVTRRLAGRSDLHMTVLATDRTRSRPRFESRDGFDVIRVPAWPRSRDYYFAPGIYRAVTSGNYDLIHCQGIHTPVPLLAMAAARRVRVPYVVSFHTGGHSSPLRTRVRSLQWQAIGPLLRSAAHLIGVSRYEARLIQAVARTDPSRMSIIRNGGGLPIVETLRPKVPGRVLSIGRLERYKGHHRVIEALPYLRREVPEAHLEILGGGPFESDLRRTARERGVEDIVVIRHIEPANRRAMADALGSASVIAALSDYEAHPVAVMEGLTAGRPVVGYDTAGMADLIEDGYVIGISPDSTPSAAAQALRDAMEQHPPAVNDLPTWETCAASLLKIYLSIVGIPSGGGTPARA